MRTCESSPPPSYLHANHEVLGNSNLTFADIKDELGALCRSIREATEATLRLLLHGSPMLEEALQGESIETSLGRRACQLKRQLNNVVIRW